MLENLRWNPGEARVLPEFFAGHHVRLFSINVTYHQVTMITVAVLVAAFLRLFFYRTSIGIAMRAVVDDPELASLNGEGLFRLEPAAGRRSQAVTERSDSGGVQKLSEGVQVGGDMKVVPERSSVAHRRKVILRAKFTEPQKAAT